MCLCHLSGGGAQTHTHTHCLVVFCLNSVFVTEYLNHSEDFRVHLLWRGAAGVGELCGWVNTATQLPQALISDGSTVLLHHPTLAKCNVPADIYLKKNPKTDNN